MKTIDTNAVEFNPYQVISRDGFANVVQEHFYEYPAAQKRYRELVSKNRYASVELVEVLQAAEDE